MKKKISAIFLLLVLALAGCKDTPTPTSVSVHKHYYKEEIKSPDCLNGGYTTFTCSCGKSYTDNFVDPLGHDYGEEGKYCVRCEVINPTYCTEGLTIVVNEDKKEAIVTSYIGEDTVINIPEEYYGVKVTEIAANVFKDSLVEKITMPSVLKIGDNAFSGSTVLSDVVFNAEIKSIGANAFKSTALQSLTLPQSLTSVGANAFSDMKDLRSLHIDATLECENIFVGSGNNLEVVFGAATTVPNKLFYGNDNLTKVTLSKNITSVGPESFVNCSSLELVNYDIIKLDTTTSLFSGCSEEFEVAFLEHVTQIPEKLFYQNDSLVEINIPKNVEAIGPYAFAKCENLDDIIFDANISTCNNIFVGSGNNIDLTIGEDVTIICDSMFENTNVVKVNGAESVTSIGKNAFKDSKLALINLSNVSTIGASAFENTFIASADLSSLKVVNEKVFKNTKLVSITGASLIETIDEEAFYHVELGSLDLTHFTKLTKINSKAFANNDKLITISFGKYFEISDDVFVDCNNVNNAYFKDSLFVPLIVDNASIGGVVGNLEIIYISTDAKFDETNYLIEFISSNEIIHNGNSYYAYHNHRWNSDYSKCLICDEEWNHYFTGGLEFELNSSKDGYIITGYNGTNVNLTIPFQYNGLPVKGVAKAAFSNDLVQSIDFNYCQGLEFVEDMAFADAINLKSVSFKNCTSLSYISSSSYNQNTGAFYNCKSLEFVEFINCKSLTTIGDSTFAGCINLEQIDLRYGQIEYILTTAFKDCSSLRRVIVPSTVTDIYANCFTNTGAVIYVEGKSEKPDTFVSNFANGCKVYYLGNNRFEDVVIEKDGYEYIEEDEVTLTILYDQLMSVEIPENITKIGSYAFNGCNSLSSVVVGENVKTIEANAFNNAYLTLYVESDKTSINSTNLVNNAVYYGTERQYSNLGFEYILVDEEIIITQVDKDVQKLEIPSTINNYPIKAIGEYSFAYSNIKEIVIPQSITTISYKAFANTNIKTIDLSGVLEVGASAFENSTLEQVEFGNELEKIETLAFANTKLTDVIIPNSCLMEAGVFYNTGLVSISLSYNFDDSISYLFTNKKQVSSLDTLKVITVTDGEVVSGAFSSTKIEEVYLHNNQTIVYYGTFSDMFDLKVVDIPGVKIIEDYAFYNTSSLTTISIENVEQIGANAFNFTGLISISLPKTLTSIGDYAFAMNTELGEIDIDIVSLDALDENSLIFEGIKTDAVVTYNDNATTAFAYMFYQTPISKVCLNNVKIVEEYVFYKCQNLEEIDFTSVEVYGKSSFEGTKIKEVVLNEDVKSIGDATFKNCVNLSNFIIPNETVVIGNNVLEGNGNISSLNVFAANFKDNHVGKLFGSNTGYANFIAASNYYVPTALDSITINGTEIYANTFVDLTNIKEVVLNGVTTIGNNAFAGCSKLETINLNEIEVISSYAFKGCKSLDEINLTSITKTINEGAFAQCNNITKMTIPFVGEAIDSTGAQALFGYIFGSQTAQDMSLVLHTYGTEGLAYQAYVPTNLTNITILSGDIGSGAFSNMTNVTNVDLPEDLKYIGANAFKDCINLKEIDLNENVEAIGKSAFANCKAIKSLYIGTNVISLGEGMLSGLSSLEEIVLPFIGGSLNVTDSKQGLFGYIFGTTAYDYSYGVVQKSNDNDTKITYYLPTKLNKVEILDGNVGYGAMENVAINNIIVNAEVISNYAFANSKIKEVKLAEGLKTIGLRAFNNCSELLEINLPTTVSTIEEYAFSGCSSVQNLVIEKNVNYIGNEAFSNCSNLGSIYYNAKRLENELSPNSNIFGKDDDSIKFVITFGNDVLEIEKYLFRNNTAVSKVSLSNSVEKVLESAFANATNLVKVEFVSGLKVIENDAFNSCVRLEEIVLPESLVSVGEKAFYNSTSVNSLIIPDLVTTIGSNAFANLENLTNLSIGESVNFVGQSAFANAKNVESLYYNIKSSDMSFNVEDQIFYNFATNSELVIEFGEDVVVVPQNLFYVESSSSRPNIKEIVFGKNVEIIKESAFYQITSIEKLDFSNAISLNTIEAKSFYQTNSLTELDLSGCSNLNRINTEAFMYSGIYTIKMPNNLKYIEQKAFKDCLNLEIIEFALEQQIEEIGISAFEGCSKLRCFNLEGANLKTISERAFANCTILSSIVLKNCYELVSIDEEAFINTAIEELDFSGNIKLANIGNKAFANISDLETIVLPEGLGNILPEAFSGNTKLKNVDFTLSTKLETIGEKAFYNAGLLEDINLNNCSNLKNINTSSFENCQSLKNLSFVNNDLEVIKEKAFMNCTGLKDLTLGSIELIETNAFMNCTGLTNLIIPNETKYIELAAFNGCGGLMSVTTDYIGASAEALGEEAIFGHIFGKDNYVNSMPITVMENIYYIPRNLEIVSLNAATIPQNAFANWTNLKVVNFLDEVEQICSNAFGGCTNLQSVTIESGVKEILSGAFSGCSALESISIPFIGKSLTATEKESVFGYIFGENSYQGSYQINQKYYKDNSYDVVSYYIPQTLKEVIFTGNGLTKAAFSGCDTLTSIQLLGDLEEIPDYAFADCKQLEELNYTAGVKTIGEKAYSNCSNISNIYILPSVESIGEKAFENLNKVLNLRLPETLSRIEIGAFSGLSGLKEISLYYVGGTKDDNNHIGYIFGSDKYGQGIECNNYYIPQSLTKVTYLGEQLKANAFANCVNFKQIDIPNTISIGEQAFSGCLGLESYEISNNVTFIGEQAFSNCDNLKNIILPYVGGSLNDNNTLKYIFGEYISNLSTVTINSTIIKENAFKDAIYLKTINIPYAEEIKSGAFTNCTGLETYSVSSMVTKIGNGVFNGCINIKELVLPYVGGALTDENTFGYIYGINDSIDTVIQDTNEYSIPLALKKVTILQSEETLKPYAFANCLGIEEINLPQSITTIGNNAFDGCSQIDEIRLPSETVVLSDYAFANCTSLSNIDGISQITNIGKYVFKNNVNIYNVTLGNNLTRIDSYAFSGCKNLLEIVVPNSVNYIGEAILNGASKLRSLEVGFVGQTLDHTENHTLGYFFGQTEFTSSYLAEQDDKLYYLPLALESVVFNLGQKVPQYAFANCTSLNNIVIPNTIMTIGEYAFSGCTKLTNYVLTSNILTLEQYAFSGCDNLYSMVINNNLKEIGDFVFSGCSKLTGIDLKEITILGNNVFDGCISIESIDIPSTCISIGSAIFNEMNKLETISLSYIGKNRNELKTLGYFFGEAEGSQFNSVTQNEATYSIPNTLKTVILKDECIIPAHAFENIKTLDNIQMDKACEILEYAFNGCSLLKTIELSETLTTIGEHAFKNCVLLNGVYVPDSVTKVGLGAFSGCYNIKEINLPFVGKENKAFDNYEGSLGYVFGEDSYLNSTSTAFGTKNYYIPNTLNKVIVRSGVVNSYAFTNCLNISNVILNNVIKVDAGAFTNTKINEISLPFTGNGSTNFDFGYIFGTTLYSDSYLSGAYYIPNSLSKVILNSNVVKAGAFTDCIKLSEVVLSNDTTTIESNAFEGCLGLNHMVIPQSVSTIGESAFGGCYATIYVENEESNVSVEALWSESNVVYWLNEQKFDNVIYNYNDMFEYGIVDNKIVITQGIKTATNIIIPNFLTVDSVSYDVTTIGTSAFEYCMFDVLSINSSTVNILSRALFNTVGNVLINNTSDVFENIENWIETNIHTPTFNVSEILTYNGFKYSKTTDSVTIVGYDSTVASELVIPSEIDSLPVKAIADYAFKGCQNLTKVVVGSNVESIGFGAFMGCFNITSMTLPFVGLNTNDSDQNQLFGAIFGTAKYDGGNQTIQVLDNREVSYYVPGKLTEIIITGSNDLIIPYGAFSGLSNVVSITINAASEISEASFSGCEKLKDLIIPTIGNAKNETEANNSTLFGYMFGTKNYNSSLYYNSVSFTNSTNSYSAYIPSSLVNVTLNGGKVLYGAFMGIKEIKNLVLPSGLESIGAYAFSGCTDLGSTMSNTIVLPNTVRVIEHGAFTNCSSIYTMDLSNSVIELKTNVFENCVNLTSVDFNENISLIGAYAFSGCTNLNNVVLPQALINLNSYVFNGCTSLSNINLANTINIYNNAFGSCTSLEGIIIPNTVTDIYNNAFNNCTNLLNLELPSSVINIGEGAFSGCSSIKSMTLPFVGSTINNTQASAETLLGYIFGSSDYAGGERITQYYNEDVAKSYYIPQSLEELHITNGALYYGALQNFNNIKTLTVSDSVAIIENEALCMNVLYNEYNGVKYLGNEQKPYIWAVKAIDQAATSLELHEDTVGIYYECFKDCSMLESFEVSNDVVSIGEGAFSGCSGLTSMSLKFIGNNYYDTTPSVKSLFGYIFGSKVYENSVQVTSFYTETLGATYYIPRSLSKITITDGNVLYGAFSYCKTIKEVTIEAGVDSVESRVFMACTQLQKMNIAFSGYSKETRTGINSLFGYIFGSVEYDNSTGCVQKYVEDSVELTVTNYIPSSLKTISLLEGNFYKNTFSNITTFTNVDLLEAAVLEVGVFNGCNNISTMDLSFAGASNQEQTNTELAYIFGNDEYIDSYSVGSYYVPLSLENIVLSSGSYATKAFNNLTSLLNVTIAGEVSLGLGMFSGCTSINTLTTAQCGTSTMGYIFGTQAYEQAYVASQNGVNYYIPESLTKIIYNGENISGYAFANFKNLIEIEFVLGLETIGAYAFSGCSSISTLDFISTIWKLENNSFDGAISLEELIIPSTITTIGSEAFANCVNINTINLFSTPVVLGSMFNASEAIGFNKITQYVSDETTVDYYMPQALEVVNVGATNVIYGALSGIKSIKEINILDSVRSISDYAFAGCSGVSEVYLPNTVTNYGRGSYGDMSGLESVELNYVGKTNDASDWTSSFGYVFDSRTNIGNTNTYDYVVSSSIKTVTYTGDTMNTYAFVGCSEITTILLPNLTVIPSYAFKDCRSLTDVILPSVLTEIEDHAFENCTGMSHIDFSTANITSIGSYAFRNAGLSVVNFTPSIKTLGAYAFENCGNAVQLVIPQTLTNIGEGAFSNWTNVESVSLYHIGQTGSGDNTLFGYIFGSVADNEDNQAVTQFNGSTNVTYYLPKALDTVTYYGTNVPEYAFSGCSTLTTISLENAKTISDYAFMGCTGLDDFDFTNITDVGENVFEGCTGFTNINLKANLKELGRYAFKDCINLTNIIFNEGITSINDYAFDGCTAITNIELPRSLENIGLGAFMDCSGLESISLYHIGQSRNSNKVFGYIFGNSQDEENNTSANELYKIPNSLKLVTFLGDYLPQYAFANSRSIYDVDLSCANINSIPAYLFYNCSGLNSVNLPNVELIETYAFANSGIENIDLVNTIKTIDSYAFSGSSLLSINILSNIKTINAYAFAEAKDLNNVIINEGVEIIGEGTFSGCSSVTSLIVPASVTSIGAKALEKMTTLNELTISYTGNGLTANEKYFGYIFGHELSTGSVKVTQSDGSSTKNYYVPESLKVVNFLGETLRSGTFSGITTLEELNFTEELTNIETLSLAFLDLERLIIPKSVTNISESALRGSSRLTFLQIPFVGNVKTTEDNEASANSVFGYIFGNVSFTGGKQVTTNYSANNSVTYYVPETLVNVYVLDGSLLYGAFTNTSVETIYVTNKVRYVAPHSLDNLVFSFPEAAVSNNVRYLIDYETNERLWAIQTRTNATSYTLDENTIGIYEGAFANVTTVTTINTNSSLSYIGPRAFSGCTKLKSITIPSGISEILEETFYGSGLESIGVENTGMVIAGAVSKIGEKAFMNNTSLKSVAFPSGLKSLQDSVFAGCTQITTLALPESLEYIGKAILNNANNLGDLTIPFVGQSKSATGKEAVLGYIFGETEFANYNVGVDQLIGKNQTHRYYFSEKLKKLTILGGDLAYGALSNLTMIANLTLPSDINVISDYALSGMTLLENVEIPTSLKTIGDYAFKGSSKLRNVVLPDSVETIGAAAFSGCEGLESMVLPFVGQSLSATKEMALFGYIFGNESGTTITQKSQDGNVNYKIPSTLTDVTILNGVVKYGAFSGCSTLVNIALNRVTGIESYAFSDCAKLKEFEIPQSVVQINEKAFSGCTSLDTLGLWFTGESETAGTSGLFGYIFDNVEYDNSIKIEQAYGNEVYTFYVPQSLENIIFNGSEIKNYAFNNVTSIYKIKFTNNLTKIGDYAFAFDDISNLMSLDLPSSLTSVGDNSFNNCYAAIYNNSDLELSTSTIETNKVYQNITVHDYEGIFEYYIDNNEVIITAVNGSLENITIPSAIDNVNVTTIAKYSFYDLEKTKIVLIGDKINKVEEDSFTNSAFDSVYIKSTTIISTNAESTTIDSFGGLFKSTKQIELAKGTTHSSFFTNNLEYFTIGGSEIVDMVQYQIYYVN